MADTLQQRARYRAAWTEDMGAARLLREMADRIDALEAVKEPEKQPCQGSGRRFPYADAGCMAHDLPCWVCGGTGAQYQGPGDKPHRYSPDIMANGDCRVCGHTKEAHQ